MCSPALARRGAALGGSLFLEDPIGRITLCQPISQSQPPTLPFSLPPPVGGSLWRDLTRIPVGIFSWKALHALNSRGHLLLEGSQICRIPVGIFSWKALHALNSLWVSSPGRLSDMPNSRGHLLLEGSPCPEFPVGIFSWKALRHLIASLCLLLGEHTSMFYFNAFIDFLAVSLH